MEALEFEYTNNKVTKVTKKVVKKVLDNASDDIYLNDEISLNENPQSGQLCFVEYKFSLPSQSITTKPSASFSAVSVLPIASINRPTYHRKTSYISYSFILRSTCIVY